jgi:hypothetical protein
MTTDPHPDPLIDSARKERARRWASTELHGYPTLSAEEETETTLAAEPKIKKQARTPHIPQCVAQLRTEARSTILLVLIIVCAPMLLRSPDRSLLE